MKKDILIKQIVEKLHLANTEIGEKLAYNLLYMKIEGIKILESILGIEGVVENKVETPIAEVKTVDTSVESKTEVSVEQPL